MVQQQGFPIQAGDRYLCYLPLAHIFERVVSRQPVFLCRFVCFVS